MTPNQQRTLRSLSRRSTRINGHWHEGVDSEYGLDQRSLGALERAGLILGFSLYRAPRESTRLGGGRNMTPRITVYYELTDAGRAALADSTED